MRCEGRGDGGPSFLSNPPSPEINFLLISPATRLLGTEGNGGKRTRCGRGNGVSKAFQNSMTHLGDFMSPSVCNSVPLAAAIAFPSTRPPSENKRAKCGRAGGGGRGGEERKKRKLVMAVGGGWWWWLRGEKKKL